MVRRLSILASAASLLLCLASLGAWGASYGHPIDFIIDGVSLHSGSTEIGCTWAWRIASRRGVLDIELIDSFYVWRIPYWKLVLASVLLPARRVQLWVRSRSGQRREGFCRTCGYDLRASADRCPECGTAIVRKVKAGA